MHQKRIFFLIAYSLFLTPAPMLLAQDIFQTKLPFYIGGQNYGEVLVRVKGEELQFVDVNSLARILQEVVKESSLEKLPTKDRWKSPSYLPWKVRYDPVSLVIFIEYQEIKSDLRPLAYSLRPVRPDIESSRAHPPAPLGGAITTQAIHRFGDMYSNRERNTVFFNSFFYISGIVLESDLQYRETQEESIWFRGDTRLVRDFVNHEIRSQAGDISSSQFGFMGSQRIGGFKVARNFSLNPYSVPYSRGSGQFTVNSRSEVRVFVNDRLVRNDILPAGHYDLQDLPLTSGLNQVRVEVLSESTPEVFHFTIPYSIQLLRKNKWGYSLSSGTPFKDENFKRNYESSHLTSGHVQYGISHSLTTGFYGSNYSDFYLYGNETAWASRLGTFFLGAARSEDSQYSGQALQGSWQYQSRFYSFIHNLNLRYEVFEEDFRRNYDEVLSGIKSRFSLYLTMPLMDQLSSSFGMTRGNYRGVESFSQRYDVSLNWRAMRNLNINLYASRLKDQFENRNDTIFAFLTWNFGDGRNLLTAFHDFENHSSRTSVHRTHNQLNSPRIMGSVEKNTNNKRMDLDTSVETSFVEVGGRIGGMRPREGSVSKETQYEGSVRMASSFVFAYQQGVWATGISRPVRNSFAIIRPSSEIKDQKLSLLTSSTFEESRSGLFSEMTAVNLTPYKYRELKIDVSNLEQGVTLENESFIVFPHYRSAHLLKLNSQGLLVVRGRIIDQQGIPLSLTTGTINDVLFFTDREGHFYIEKIAPGRHELMIDGYRETFIIEVPYKKRGVLNVSDIVLDRSRDF